MTWTRIQTIGTQLGYDDLEYQTSHFWKYSVYSYLPKNLADEAGGPRDILPEGSLKKQYLIWGWEAREGEAENV